MVQPVKIPYEEREKKAIEALAKFYEKVLDGFENYEQPAIRQKLGSYTLGYLGLSWGLHYGS